jgi:hypothetical protein
VRVGRALGLGLAVVLALAAAPARAALGEAEDSVAKDRRALAATALTPTDAGSYRVHELVTGGSTIREYVNGEGVVFAVAWSGISNPDLGPLLGSYADEYRAAAHVARGTPRAAGRRAVRVEGPHVVVDRWGHMRDRHGRAWLPELLPAGVSVDDLR